MSRIDIEGTLSLLGEHHHRRDQSYLETARQRQQFARYLPPQLRSPQEMAHALASSQGCHSTQCEYNIVSGPLSGTKVSVSLTHQGLHILLSHTNRDLIERLQRVQTRWQRQLHMLGFPCLLEVTHAGESDG